MASVTVCVPVYNGAPFVADTIASILSQRFTDFVVRISVDAGDDDSEAICRRFLGDRRVAVVAQPVRLGWVANVNGLLARVETPRLCLVPHDDQLHRDYLSRLSAMLDRDPDAACAYADLGVMGAPLVHVQSEVRGARTPRLVEVLLHHWAAVAYRGLVRRRGDGAVPLVPSGLPHDLGADSAWLAAVAREGALRRVGGRLYEKRYAPSTVHAGWQRRPLDQRAAAWAAVAARCLRLALEGEPDARQRALLILAARLRARGIGDASDGTGLPAHGAWREAAARQFVRDTADLEDIDEQEVLAWPDAVAHRRALAADRSPWPSWRRVRRAFRWRWVSLAARVGRAGD